MSAATAQTILITGVTGFIGGRLATLALERGYDVRGLARSEWPGQPAIPVRQRFLGELPANIPAEALYGVHAVVHCAAGTEGVSAAQSHAVNVTGTLRLAEMAKSAGVQTFIYISSQSAKPNAVSAYGRTKYEAEQALARIEGLNVIVLRPGLVSGPGSRGLFGRLSASAARLPVVPLIGGGRQIVQPVHVDDLCEAILICLERSTELRGAIFRLGMPGGVTLETLLQEIAGQTLGHPRRTVTIPLEWVEAGVRLGNALRLPLPITLDNVQGLKTIETMDTAPDLQRLGLTLRSFESAIAIQATQPAPVARPAREPGPVGVLLVGAGRIGLVHAITLSRQQGVTLAGIVDRKPGAIRMLHGIGIRARGFSDLDEAVSQTGATAAVIATPASTHLALARACLAHGLRLLIEKPLAIKAEQLDEYEALVGEYPGASVHAGYTLLSSPHVQLYLRKLRSGELGTVRRFSGFTLLSFIREPGFKRWEVQRAVSGGGVLMNSGVHVLSMIHAAFGAPADVKVQSRRQFSDDVEDCIVCDFRYEGFAGTHYASWSIGGYPRQENRLVVETDRGRLVLTGSMAVFLPHDGEAQMTHQLDHDVGFNLAPDYAGSGFSAELRALADGGSAESANGLAQALQLERLTFRIYAAEQRVGRFRPASGNSNTEVPASMAPSEPTLPQPAANLVLDLRALDAGEVSAAIASAEHSRWREYEVTPPQALRLLGGGFDGSRLRVTVPDFLNQSRQLAQGNWRDVLFAMTPTSFVEAGFSTLAVLPRTKTSTFWVAAFALFSEAVHALPSSFNGTLILDTYLVDLALSLRKNDLLDAMLAKARKARPGARVGIHTNLASEALNALSLLSARVDCVSVLTSPNAPHLPGILRELRPAGGGAVAVTVEVGPAPACVHQIAARNPAMWTFGVADALLVGLPADPKLAAQQAGAARREWSAVFPGIEMPAEAL